MRTSAVFKNAGLLFLLLWLAFFSIEAQAAIDNAGVLDNVLSRYSAAASTWSAFITARATWLFWTLALISMVWTFGLMALRKADIGEFYAEFVSFTIFTGFYWWLLTNGPNFATDIMNSLRQIAASSSGLGSTLTPSGIVDIGFDIFFKVLDQSSVWSPVDSTAGIAISTAILVILALIGVNMLLLLVSSWILAYAGVFFLGFGGSRWTSDMAINYYKTVLSIAAQLFTMVLLVGIGKSFVDQYYAGMSAGISIKELGVMLIVALILLALVKTVPSMIGGLAMGSGAHSLGSGFGAGAVMGAAAMAGAAIATGGAAIAAGAASAAGGAQALMAAFQKASAAANEGGGSGMSDMMSAYTGGGSGDTSGGSALAEAMGDSSFGGSSSFGGGGGFGGDSSSGSSDKTTSSASGGESKGTNSDTKGGGAPGEQKSGGSMLAKAGKIAAGTVSNLAQGSLDVAKTKMANMRESAIERISETTGGKIAAAIKGTTASATSTFDDNHLAAGNSESSTSAASEVAAFVNSKTS